MELINDGIKAPGIATLETTRANEEMARHTEIIQDMEGRRLDIEITRVDAEQEIMALQKTSLEDDSSMLSLKKSKLTNKVIEETNRRLGIELCPRIGHLLCVFRERTTEYAHPAEGTLKPRDRDRINQDHAGTPIII